MNVLEQDFLCGLGFLDKEVFDINVFGATICCGIIYNFDARLVILIHEDWIRLLGARQGAFQTQKLLHIRYQRDVFCFDGRQQHHDLQLRPPRDW